MKLAFKFNTFGIISFVVMCGLCYWLCPAIASPLWRAVVYGGFGLCAFGACFIIVRAK